MQADKIHRRALLVVIRAARHKTHTHTQSIYLSLQIVRCFCCCFCCIGEISFGVISLAELRHELSKPKWPGLAHINIHWRTFTIFIHFGLSTFSMIDSAASPKITTTPHTHIQPLLADYLLFVCVSVFSFYFPLQLNRKI